MVFQSFASDLVEGDYNDTADIFVARLGGPDTDQDGMDDDWEVLYFGKLGRDGNGDFDGDGMSDGHEFSGGNGSHELGRCFGRLIVAAADLAMAQQCIGQPCRGRGTRCSTKMI